MIKCLDKILMGLLTSYEATKLLHTKQECTAYRLYFIVPRDHYNTPVSRMYKTLIGTNVKFV